MTRSWAIRGEYRYTDFGTVADASTYAAPLGTLFTGTRRLDQNLVEFGVSYKFGEEGAGAARRGGRPSQPQGCAGGCAPAAGVALARLLCGRERGWRLRRQERTSGDRDLLGPEPALRRGMNPNLAYIPGGANTGAGGALGGGQVGYNYQFGASVVIGAEADIAITSVSGGGKQNAALYASPFSAGGVLAPAAPLNAAQASLPYVGTLRGRAGYLVTPTLLLHTTAGFAYDGVDAWGVANSAPAGPSAPAPNGCSRKTGRPSSNIFTPTSAAAGSRAAGAETPTPTSIRRSTSCAAA